MRTVEELEAMLGDVSWETFEGLYSGEFHVRIEKSFLGFFMRVGTHFRRPMQVVIAEGAFVRMRNADQWADCNLKELNASKPQECIYPESFKYEAGTTNKPIWKPFKPYQPPYGGYQQNIYSSVTPGISSYSIGIGAGSGGSGGAAGALQAQQAQMLQAQIQAQQTTGLGLGHVPSLPGVK